MRISDWSSDVCSSDLPGLIVALELRALLIVGEVDGHPSAPEQQSPAPLENRSGALTSTGPNGFQALACGSTTRMCSSPTCLNSAGLGAPISRSSARCFIGKRARAEERRVGQGW